MHRNAKNSMNKYQLIARNVKTLEEKQILVFKPRWIYLLSTFIVVAIMCLSFWMFNTIFSRWVNPLDYYNISREKFTHIVNSLNELELTARQNEQFVALLQNIIAGKEVDINSVVASTKSSPQNSDVSNNIENRKTIDSPITSAIEPPLSADKEKNLTKFNRNNDIDNPHLIFLPPASGRIVAHYMEKDNPYKNGITLVSHVNTPICCIADGVIIFSEYVMNQNIYTTIIQHSQSIISVYRHFAKCLLTPGSMVHTGDVISIVNNSGQGGNYNFVFELWIDFHQVNPEDHIIF